MGRSSLWSISCSRHQIFLPLHHDFCRPGPWKWRSTPRDVAIFSLSFFFFGRTKNLVERIVAVHPPKTGKRRNILGLHLDEPLNWGESPGFSVWIQCDVKLSQVFLFRPFLLVYLSYLCGPVCFFRSAEYLKYIQWIPAKFATKVRQGRNMHFSWYR